jgi:RNA polymerase sigma-70 factor (ECF subfamily)
VWSVDDDLELARAAARDSCAFATLYRRHVSSVYRYLMARVGDIQDAQDLTAETFLSALRNINRFRGQGTLIAWLLSIAHHAAADHFRRNSRGTRHDVPLGEAEDLPDPAGTAEDAACHRLDRAQVLGALQQLSLERAEAVVLRVVLELSVAETGLVMGKSEAAIKMLVHRALADLRQHLVAMAKEEDAR